MSKNNSEDLIYIGEKIRQERKRQNISQECLAGDVGMSQRNFSNAENGLSNMKIENFIAVCDALSVSPIQLLPDRLSTNKCPYVDALRIAHRLEQFSEKKKAEVLLAIDMILKLAEA